MTAQETYKYVMELYIPVLAKHLGEMPKHGMEVKCPECGSPGHLDLNTNNLSFAFTDSIYFAAWNFTWRCISCDLPK